MMKILCDTHILIWFLTGDDRLSVKARTIIENEENEIYFSLVSVQAKIEKLTFITHASLIPDYNEPCIVSV